MPLDGAVSGVVTVDAYCVQRVLHIKQVLMQKKKKKCLLKYFYLIVQKKESNSNLNVITIVLQY